MIELTADRESHAFLVGRRHSPHVEDLRAFLSRNGVAFGWVDLDHDPLVRALGARVPDGLRPPVFVYADGSVSEWPAGDDHETAYALDRALRNEHLRARPFEGGAFDSVGGTGAEASRVHTLIITTSSSTRACTTPARSPRTCSPRNEIDSRCRSRRFAVQRPRSKAKRNRSAEVDARFDEIATYLAAINVGALLQAATEVERRILIDEMIEAVDVHDDHLEVIVCGAPRLNVTLAEVGLDTQVNFSRVGGGTCQPALRGFADADRLDRLIKRCTDALGDLCGSRHRAHLSAIGVIGEPTEPLILRPGAEKRNGQTLSSSQSAGALRG